MLWVLTFGSSRTHLIVEHRVGSRLFVLGDQYLLLLYRVYCASTAKISLHVLQNMLWILRTYQMVEHRVCSRFFVLEPTVTVHAISTAK